MTSAIDATGSSKSTNNECLMMAAGMSMSWAHPVSADNYFDFKFSLEKLFERNVYLIEEKAIRNPFFRNEVNNTKIPVYG